MVSLRCKSRKELENIQHPAAFVLPDCDRGTHITIQSLNVPAGQFLFCYPWHHWGLHPGGLLDICGLHHLPKCVAALPSGFLTILPSKLLLWAAAH